MAGHHLLRICAALVENPVNLAGLCRTAAVFALAELVLPDLAVAETWAFRQVAASGQHWQPLTACPPGQLPAWIAAQQRQGYEIWALDPRGAEPLTCHRFAPRTALVLGRELTGVPPEILARCEGAIAIPQFGPVDSLNVHTAAAIAIYEYVRQHGPP